MNGLTIFLSIFVDLSRADFLWHVTTFLGLNEWTGNVFVHFTIVNYERNFTFYRATLVGHEQFALKIVF